MWIPSAEYLWGFRFSEKGVCLDGNGLSNESPDDKRKRVR